MGTVYAAVAAWLAYVLIVAPVMGYLESRRTAQDGQEVSAAMVKIRGDFDDYLRAAPLLKGNTERAFSRVVDERLEDLGFDWRDKRLAGLAPAQRWRRAIELLEADKRAAAQLERQAAEDFEKCLAIFDADRCELMVAGAYCLTEGCPTIEAAQMFEDAAFDAGYVREDEACDSW